MSTPISGSPETKKTNPILAAVTSDPAPKKPAVASEYQPSAAPSTAAQFYGLNGPGVSASVFGPVSPNIKAWSDAELCKNLIALRAAIKASPGKVNAYDVKLYAEMTTVAAYRYEAKLTPKTSPDKMQNGELFEAMLALDMEKASGQPLTKEQADFLAKADKVVAERAKHDKSAAEQVAQLTELRAKLKTDIAVKCAAVATTGAGMLGAEFIGALGSAMLIVHALKEGDYGAALKEGAGVAISVAPVGHLAKKLYEGVSLAENAIECTAAKKELKNVEFALAYEKGRLAAGASQ